MAKSTKQIFKNFPIVKVYVTSMSIKWLKPIIDAM